MGLLSIRLLCLDSIWNRVAFMELFSLLTKDLEANLGDPYSRLLVQDLLGYRVVVRQP